MHARTVTGYRPRALAPTRRSTPMLTSFWESRAASPDVSTTTDDVPATAGTVVAGGGLTGLTTALLLAEAGEEVVLLEARHLGAGTTGRSTAKVSLLQGTHYSQVARRHGADVLRDYAAANRDAQAWLVAFAEQEGVPVQQRPAVTYANGGRGIRALRGEQDAVERAGLAVRWSSDVELPFEVAGALWLDDQYQVDPVALVAALARRCRAAGVRVVEGVRVTGVRETDRLQVGVRLTGDGAGGDDEVAFVQADRLVVATNLPFLDRGAFFARMSPQRSYSLAMELPADRAADLPRAMYLAADPPSRSVRDAGVADGPPVLLVGGAGHGTGRSRPTSSRLDELRSWTAEHFPGSREVAAWSAQDYAPHHALPVAGPVVPGNRRVLVAGGFSKWGMTGGVAAALALAADVAGTNPPSWRPVLRPWTRKELSGLPSSALMNLEVGLAMAAGWTLPSATSVGSASASRSPDVRPRSRVCGLRRGDGTTGSAVCTHLGGVLTWNDAEHSWDCPLHGSRFEEEGEVLEGPAVRPLPTPSGHAGEGR